MWILGCLLPVMVGQWVPVGDEHWQPSFCFLTLWTFLLVPEISPEDVSLLSTQIQDHHHDFKALYPGASITPKMHFMVHVPGLILQ